MRPAARALQVTRSSVSRHVSELEAWLGVALLEKGSSNARLVFTPQGRALGKAALEGLSALAHAVEGARELRRANSVVIATPTSFGARWLIPRLPTLRKTHEWIEVSVITQQAVQELREQGADLAIRTGGGPWSDGKCEPLMDDELYPVTTRDIWSEIRARNPARALTKARLCTTAIRSRAGTAGSRSFRRPASICAPARGSPHRISYCVRRPVASAWRLRAISSRQPMSRPVC